MGTDSEGDSDDSIDADDDVDDNSASSIASTSDESDTITRKEIADTVADFDLDGSMAGDVDALFLELDRDEDGTVTYSEFRKAFKSFLKGLKKQGKKEQQN